MKPTQQPTSELVRTVRYAPGRQMPRHCDGRARISLVLSGELCETAGRSEVSAGALGVAVKSADAPHATCFGPGGARVVSINLERLADPEWSIPHWRWARGAELQDELRAVVAAVIEHRSAPRPRDTLDGLGEACLLLADRMQGRAPEVTPARPWLRRVRRHIDEAPEQPVRIGQLAREAGVSAAHLTRRFKSVFGCSVVEYRTRQRVRFALERLERPGLGLAEVALESGFHDQAHFTRHFRAVTGTTPGAWRRNLLAA